jgi:2-polyprenyl-3-methyl-5-hydroxy-6-metoxy-1,4-benzoquinol methylase
MADADRTKWDEKYAEPGFRRGAAPASLIRGVAAALPRAGLALDIACGEGQNLVYLAERGLDGIGLDISEIGIEKAAELAGMRGVDDQVSFLCHDLDDGLPDVGGPFDVIVCVHFHAPQLYPRLRGMLAPGGFLVVETLTTENVELDLPHPSAKYLAAPSEVLGYATGMRIRLYREAVVDGTVRAQLLAQDPQGPPPDLRR